MSTSAQAHLTLNTRSLRSPYTVSQAGDTSAGAPSPSPISPVRASLLSQSRSTLKNNMSQYSTSTPVLVGSVPKIPSASTHAKLQKRAPPANLVSGASSPPTPSNVLSQFVTPYATPEDPFPDVPQSPATSASVPKIKPYLRKMSSAREDQGQIDLSKSTSENDQLAGLGIPDFPVTAASDVSFAHSRRGQQHGRNTSTGSQVSNGSGRFVPTQPFVHPMVRAPRPYTPPGASYPSSVNEQEANESDDVVEDEFGLASGFRTGRSMSISSTPANNPTPLSQSHTALDLGLIPKLTTATSQSNLSLASYISDNSKSKKKRPRRNTDLSQEYIPSESARTSLDKSFAFRPRRSDTDDVKSRNERILEARRKFEEKEANKDRKHERQVNKRRESDAKRGENQRRRSDAQSQPLKSSLKQNSSGSGAQKKRRKSSVITVTGGAEENAEKLHGRSYEDYRPSHAASLPVFGTRPGESEKTPRYEYSHADRGAADGGWLRFSTWLQTRMLSCGGRD